MKSVDLCAIIVFEGPEKTQHSNYGQQPHAETGVGNNCATLKCFENFSGSRKQGESTTLLTIFISLKY